MTVAQESRGLPLGAAVVLKGVVIGRSEFQNGPPSYLIQYSRKGKIDREWFTAVDLGLAEGEGQ